MSKYSNAARFWMCLLMPPIMTALFTFTKMSFLSLSQLMAAAKPRSDNFEYKQLLEYAGLHVIIYLVLIVPYLLTILRAFVNGFNEAAVECHGSCTSTSILSYLFLLLNATLEPVGLALLAFKVLPNTDPLHGVLFMSLFATLSVIFHKTVEFIKGFKHTIKELKGNYKKLKCTSQRLEYISRRILYTIGFVYGCGFVGTMMAYWIHRHEDNGSSILCYVFCLLCLSFAWLPALQKTLVKILPEKKNTSGNDQESGLGQRDPSDPSVDGHQIASDQQVTNGTPIQAIVNEDRPLSWWTVCTIYILKTISISICAAVIFLYDMDYSSTVTIDSRFFFSSECWDLGTSITDARTWIGFGTNLVGGFLGYVIVVFGFQTRMQLPFFAVPAVLSIIASYFLCAFKNEVMDLFIDASAVLPQNKESFIYSGFSLGLVLVFTIFFCTDAKDEEDIHLQPELKIFWIPSYNGAALEGWLYLNRRHRLSKLEKDTSKAKVYICTTMYREDKREITQLIESLARVKNQEQKESMANFESHIIIDGGIHNKRFSEFALTLLAVFEEKLEIKIKDGEIKKIDAPYGTRLSFTLKNKNVDNGMDFYIHLKDSSKVKNKKRWSQVMYMSYIFDLNEKQGDKVNNSYILATDADVSFTIGSVNALLRIMMKDSSIGAVCGRTIPVGSGPLVWYQEFEYAVGHWFQKTAENVLGSVMCAPGCFSVYRCDALKEILPDYQSKVEKAFDFLIKDMGEDRWMCTLLMGKGWNIEYCAASENRTHCPDNFDEFFKQRRRWIASTLANMVLTLKDWPEIRKKNHNFNVIYLIYQSLTLFATLIAPTMVILVVAGGLEFGWGINDITSLVLQLFFALIFAVICLYATSSTQLMAAKLYTFGYAMVMCAVIVGTAEQTVRDLTDYDEHNERADIKDTFLNNTKYIATTKNPNHHISDDVPVSLTTIYLFFLIGMYIFAALVHPRDLTCLPKGFFYILCLPSAFLILIIYSVCNLTDSSWGTREETKHSNLTTSNEWEYFLKWLYTRVFFCCGRPKGEGQLSNQAETPTTTEGEGQASNHTVTAPPATGTPYQGKTQSQDNKPVEEWLPPEFSNKYTAAFKCSGFENEMFIKGIKEEELVNRVGVRRRGHVHYILAEAARLPSFDLDYNVPDDVNEWLRVIGLSMYENNFKQNKIEDRKSLAILKGFSIKEIHEELKITKYGHVKRLLYAIRMMREPTKDQKDMSRIRQDVDQLAEKNLSNWSKWTTFDNFLKTSQGAFGNDDELNAQLLSLRNGWLMRLVIANILWLILEVTIDTKGVLVVFGSNPFGVAFVFVFGLLFLIQCLAMLVHRTTTLCHYMVEEPVERCNPFPCCCSCKREDVETASTSKETDQPTTNNQNSQGSMSGENEVLNQRSSSRDQTEVKCLYTSSQTDQPSTAKRVKQSNPTRKSGTKKVPIKGANSRDETDSGDPALVELTNSINGNDYTSDKETVQQIKTNTEQKYGTTNNAG